MSMILLSLSVASICHKFSFSKLTILDVAVGYKDMSPHPNPIPTMKVFKSPFNVLVHYHISNLNTAEPSGVD